MDHISQCANDKGQQGKKCLLCSLNSKFLAVSKEQMSQKSKFSVNENQNFLSTNFGKNCYY